MLADSIAFVFNFPTYVFYQPPVSLSMGKIYSVLTV